MDNLQLWILWHFLHLEELYPEEACEYLHYIEDTYTIYDVCY